MTVTYLYIYSLVPVIYGSSTRLLRSFGHSLHIAVTRSYIWYVIDIQIWSVFSNEAAQRNDAGHLVDGNVFKTTQSLCYLSKRNTTELPKYYLELRDKGVDKTNIKVVWNIERQAYKYKCGTRRCDLCLTEKPVMALADKSTMPNKRSEIV